MGTLATVIGLAAAVCTTGANLPQLKKAWTTGQTDDISIWNSPIYAPERMALTAENNAASCLTGVERVALGVVVRLANAEHVRA